MMDRTLVSGVSSMRLAGLVQHLFGVTVVGGDEQDISVFFARVVHSPDGNVYDRVFYFSKKTTKNLPLSIRQTVQCIPMQWRI